MTETVLAFVRDPETYLSAVTGWGPGPVGHASLLGARLLPEGRFLLSDAGRRGL